MILGLQRARQGAALRPLPSGTAATGVPVVRRFLIGSAAAVAVMAMILPGFALYLIFPKDPA